MSLKTIGDIYSSLYALKCEVDDKLEEISDEDDREELEAFMEEIEESLQYFDDENYYYELRVYDDYKERWRFLSEMI